MSSVSGQLTVAAKQLAPGKYPAGQEESCVMPETEPRGSGDWANAVPRFREKFRNRKRAAQEETASAFLIRFMRSWSVRSFFAVAAGKVFCWFTTRSPVDERGRKPRPR